MRFALDFHPFVKIDLAEAEVLVSDQRTRFGGSLALRGGGGICLLGRRCIALSPRVSRTFAVSICLGFQSAVFYFVAGESVVVLGVLHAARDGAAELCRPP